MTRVFLLITFVLSYHFMMGQEIVNSIIETSSTASTTCASCDGSLTATLNEPGIKTFEWYDVNNTLLFNESTANNFSTVNNLCIGTYRVRITYGQNQNTQVWAAVTEANIDLSNTGNLYSCTSLEELDFNQIESQPSTTGGYWANSSGLEVNVLLTNNLFSGEVYSYNVLNGGCLNTINHELILNEPANSGDGTTYIICEDFNEFELIDPMAGNPDENGIWYNSNDEVTDGMFNPATDDAELFTYLIDTVPGCPASFSTLQIIKNFIPYAGEDGILNSCQAEDQSVNLIDYLTGTPDAGGVWYDMNNQLIDGTFNPLTMEEGTYRYTVSGNVPCPADISYVYVEFIDELLVGEGADLELCSNEGELELASLLDEQYTAGGSWIDENGLEVNGFFNPALQNSQTLTYAVNGVGCTSVESTFQFEVENFESAGEDQIIELCESSTQVNLNEFLLEGTPLTGTWYENGVQLNSTMISGAPDSHVFSYDVNHQICAIENSVLQLIINDNPLFPEINDLFVCENSEVINLDDLANFSPEWISTWTNLDTNLEQTEFDPALGIEGDFLVEVDPQNICDVATENIQIQLESNAFEDDSFTLDLCSSEGEVNLYNIIENQIGSPNFELINFPSTIETPLYLGNSTIQAIETPIYSCQPSQLLIEVMVHEYAEPELDVIENLCGDQDVLDLEEFNQQEGVWEMNGVELNSTQIEQDPLNSGTYIFTPLNHPVCPQLAQNVELNFAAPFTFEELENVELCLGEELNLISPLVENTYSTTWSFNQEEVNQNALEINSELLNSGEFPIEYTITDGICQNSANLSLTVHPLPVFEIQGEETYCSGETINLGVWPSVLGDINWFLGGEFMSDQIEHSFLAEASTLVSAQVIDLNSCEYTEELAIEVNPTPEAEIIQSPQAFCAPELASLSYTDENGLNTHLWVVNGETSSNNLLSIEVNPGDSIDVQLITTSIEGCVSTDGAENFYIGYGSAQGGFDLSSNTISDISGPILVTNQSTNFNVTSWSLNEEYLTSEEDFQIEYFDLISEENELCLVVNNEYNCPDSLCKALFIVPELSVYVPNAFTPDQDGLNEIFVPVVEGNSPEDYNFLVFNRWGEVIFSSQTPGEGWNGSVNNGNHYAQPGVYSFMLVLREESSSKIKEFRGSVTLIR